MTRQASTAITVAKRRPRRTLGLDLAKTTGVVVVGPNRRILFKETFTTKAAGEADQCYEIRNLVDRVVKDHGPFAVVGIEDTWLGKNVGLLKHLSRIAGAVLVTLADHSQAYRFITPNAARKELRLPFGPKAEVHRVLRARRSVPRDLTSDELDAYVVAVAVLHPARPKVDWKEIGRRPAARRPIVQRPAAQRAVARRTKSPATRKEYAHAA